MSELDTTPTSPEVEALKKDNEKLHHRLDIVENAICAAKEVLNLEEAACFLGLKKSALYKMTHNMVIPFYRPGGKMVYFEKSELLAWLRQNRVASKANIEEAASLKLAELALR